MKSIAMESGGPVMPEIEVARDRQIVSQRRVLEMTHAGRANARFGQLVVEPRRGAIAEVRADGGVNRDQHLQQDERRARERQRRGQAIAMLDGADEHAHRNPEENRQHAPEDEDEPPAKREAGSGLRQHREEDPFLARAQALQHGHRLS